MLLGRRSLDSVRIETAALKENLTESVRKIFALFQEMRRAHSALRAMNELNSHQEYLSPSYLQFIRHHPEIAPLDKLVKEVSQSVYQSALVRLLEDMTLFEGILLEEELTSHAMLLDSLRESVVECIKESLDHYFTAQQSSEKITKKFLHLLENFPLRGDALCFSDALDQMSLLELIRQANEVIRETDTQALWKLLHSKKIGDKDFYDYFRCEFWFRKRGYCLTLAPQESAFMENKLIPEEYEKFSEHLATVNAFRNSFDDNGDRWTGQLRSAIKSCCEKLQSLYDKLCVAANTQAAMNVAILDKINRNLNIADYYIKQLKQAAEELQKTLEEQTSLLEKALKISLDDDEEYKKNGLMVKENERLIQYQKNTLEHARQAVDTNLRFAECFEEKEEASHHGVLYQQSKTRYLDVLFPAYTEAMTAANAVLQETENLQKKNSKFIQQVNIVNMNVAKRAFELEASKELQTIFDSYKTVKKHCDEAGSLLTSVFELEKSLFDAGCGIDENTSLDELQKRLTLVVEQTERRTELRARLDENHKNTARLLGILIEKQRVISSADKKTETYRMIEKNLREMRSQLLDRETSIPARSHDVSEMLKKMVDNKQNELLNQLLQKLNFIFDDEHIQIRWRRQSKSISSTFIDNCKINVGTATQPEMIAVTETVFHIRKMLESNVQPKATVERICLHVKTALHNNKKRSGEIDANMGLFQIIASFQQEGNNELIVTKEKLASLQKVMDAMFPSSSHTLSLSHAETSLFLN